MAISLLLIIALCWWIAYSEVRTKTTEITCTSLPIGVVFALFVLCAVNTALRSWKPQAALAPAELAAIYVITAVGSSVAGIGMVGFLTPGLANPVWFTNQNWQQFANAVPCLWSPRDPAAVRDFYVGHSTLYTWQHVRAWIPPLLTWGSFLMVLLTMMLCLSSILRKQWIEAERLAFPITYVPIAMTLGPGGFGGLMRGKAMLWGFLIPVVLQSVNSLHWLYPSMPYLPVKPTANGPLDLGPFFTSPPWNALGYFPLAFHPNTIGLSYLLSTDISFSCWFFYLLRKGSEVWAVAAGFHGAGGNAAGARMPYTPEQGAGAWISIAALTIWMARKHLAVVWRAAINPSAADDTGEGMSYRLAVFGAIGSFAALVAFACWGGLAPLASVLLFLVVGAYLLALVRIRAEVGTAWHFGPWVSAPEMVVRAFGPANLNLSSLSVLAYHNWYNVDYRSTTAPHFIEGYRIADQGGIAIRRLTIAMLAAAMLGFACACWTVLHLYYAYGAGSAHVNSWRIDMNKIGFEQAAAHLSDRRLGPDGPGIWAVA
ncbi:MAG TPA: DUF6785 family protein, partial [Chthonomonadales bacterium]|nr:DUF6785 family protein [Chthonomonadales bacterium]